MPESHTPVLLDDVLRLLAPAHGETAADLTAGLGGHAAALADAMGQGRMLLCDLDPGNLLRAEAAVRETAGGLDVVPHRGSFVEAPATLERLGWAADMVLADLGFSSNQVDDPQRGLSFREDGPLDMRLDPDGPLTAADLVNETPEQELADLIYQYGEERASRRVARAICQRRSDQPFERTGDLAAVVRRAVPGAGKQRIDGATRTFQALRIAVNGELDALEGLLGSIERGARAVAAGEQAWLAPGARIGIIAFHSLEDRPVKQAMQAWASAGLGERVTRKPTVAEEAEAAGNRRARSAKLRVFRLAGGTAHPDSL